MMRILLTMPASTFSGAESSIGMYGEVSKLPALPAAGGVCLGTGGENMLLVIDLDIFLSVHAWF